MYAMYESDANMETGGIWVDYGDFRVRIARAGGSNKKYMKYAENRLKPFRRMLQQGGDMPEKRSHAILADIFAKTIVLDWNVSDGEADEDTGEIPWKQGIHARDGSVLEFSEGNVYQTLKNLPNLLIDLQNVANTVSMFAREELEEDAKN